jgi:hypothetical protein
MRVASLPKIRRLNPDLVPPREAKPVGLHDDGRMIYEMERRDLVATKKNKVQVIGPDGEPLFRRDGQGEPYPVMRTEPVSYTSRFVLERSPSGAVFMNEHFEATESDRELDRAKAMESAFSEILAKTAIERGLSAEDLIARLIDPIKEAGPGQVLVEEDYPIHRGGQAWILSNGDTFNGTRRGAEEAESNVSGKSFDAPEVEVEAVEEEATEEY